MAVVTYRDALNQALRSEMAHADEPLLVHPAPLEQVARHQASQKTSPTGQEFAVPTPICFKMVPASG